jgi:hypothetical protein
MTKRSRHADAERVRMAATLTHEERLARRRPPPSVWRTPAGRTLAASVAVLAIATLAGLAALWPHGGTPSAGATAAGGATGATVVSTSTKDCGGPTRQSCLYVRARLDEGRDRNRVVPVLIGPADFAPEVGAGQAIRVLGGGGTYAFAEVDRRAPLLWLAVAVAIAAVVLVRLRGVLAVLGLAVSLVLVTRFVLPAILDGRPPLLVALVGAMAVTIVTLALTSGLGVQSMTAFVGIAATLLVAAVLGAAFAHIDHLDGRSSDAANALIAAGSHISLQGVVVAGVVLGALGALTDTAVTQASAVMAPAPGRTRARRARPVPRGLRRRPRPPLGHGPHARARLRRRHAAVPPRPARHEHPRRGRAQLAAARRADRRHAHRHAGAAAVRAGDHRSGRAPRRAAAGGRGSARPRARTLTVAGEVRRRGGRLVELVGPRDRVRLDATALCELDPDVPGRDVYLCGPDALARHLVAELRRAGVPKRRIHLESFSF